VDPKLQRRVQRYGWDKASSTYERYWHQQLAPAQDRLLEMAGIRPGERVLDVACGTGVVSFRAAELTGPSGAVVATDISEAMVTAVKQEASNRAAANVTAARMDAEVLDFPGGSFDVALCALGLMYVPDPGAALAEMRRVLKPQGRAVAAVWGPRSKCGWAEIFPIVEARVQSDVCPMFFQLGVGNRLALTFEQAGFRDVTAESISTVLRYDSAADACGAAFAGGPVALAYSHFDGATRESAHAEYLASIEPWRAGAAYNVPGEFVIVSGAA